MSDDSRERFVQVPRALLKGVPAVEVSVWVLLAKYRDWDAPARPVYPRRATLMEGLGRAGCEPRAITNATTRLARRGWLSKGWVRRGGRTVTLYRLRVLDDEDPWVPLSMSVLDKLADPNPKPKQKFTPELLLELMRWHDACGGNGRTSDSLAAYAERFEVPVRTARRLRSKLVALGLLGSTSRPGAPSETTVPDLADMADRFTAEPRPNPADHPGQTLPTTPATSGRPPRPDSSEAPGQIWPTERDPVERDPGDLDPGERVLGPVPASVTDARAEKADDDETRPIAEVVAQRLGCAAPRAEQLVQEVELRHAPRNLRSYVRTMLQSGDLARLHTELPMPTPPAVPWCGSCDSPDLRYVEEESGGRWAPCPRCSPQAAAQRRAEAS